MASPRHCRNMESWREKVTRGGSVEDSRRPSANGAGGCMWEPVLNPLPPGFFAKRYVNESEVLHREIELGEGRARLRVGTLRHGVTGVSGAS
eukprot:CAMPEP_0174295812 /NCGR_PEP_ID=MMETSP0809-20121228/45924_1 /TAXON_ID=73025 ORGANISM="Eutreptiella gymnastica-like, Strain CCMP1594" /NCGR_SAMPLE_ID=MMETSP0809 /ASSEMBLY_ACC=CAM_ASM_000658 /LENGTH=91 /DNA_ID=CAMNT_0015398359 /DNA_START=161 /DNA_END=432 /DNA_ORIENTATION=+